MRYRLIYLNGIILVLTVDEGITDGPASVFNGTAAEVLAKVTELNLQDPDNWLTILNENI